MAAIEERVSRMEGAHEYLASKADVHQLRTELALFKGEVMVAFTEVRQAINVLAAEVTELKRDMAAVKNDVAEIKHASPMSRATSQRS